MKTAIGCALGECVHVAGVMKFLHQAENAGYQTVFLGPAVPITRVLSTIQEQIDDGNQPDEIVVGVSYRLTPENGEQLLGTFAEQADDFRSSGVRFAFGGTPPVAERVSRIGFFERVFFGGEPETMTLAYLRGHNVEEQTEDDYPQSTIERIQWKAPYPLFRHHFGLPTMDETIRGIEKIAEASVLDVISLGVDQDSQANFFHPERQNPQAAGAGGAPVRSAEDYHQLYAATRRGNYPLLRTYSGTDDFIQLAEMYVETINIAWCAIPLFWFNQMDGRGEWDLEGSIREHQRVMAWYGEREIPVELNEPHHWGMRDAPDVLFVVAAFLSAYNARAFGVHDYIAQLMFNSPPGTSDRMDLAKMLAVLELILPLSGPDFRVWKQTRTGLLSYPLDKFAARGHLAANIYLQMALDPHIVHIVGHTEAHHAATAEDIVEAVKLTRRPVENAVNGQPDMTKDPLIIERCEQLVNEANITLEAIQLLADPTTTDPWTDPVTLARAVSCGLLDAPHLANNEYALGTISTHIDGLGACIVIDPQTGAELSETERIMSLGLKY